MSDETQAETQGCQHHPKLKVDCGRFNSPEGRPGMGLFISVSCTHCGEPFVFPGLPGEEMPTRVCGENPTTSPDHTLVRIPMYAKSDAPDDLEPEPVMELQSIARLDIPLSELPPAFQQALGLTRREGPAN